MKPEKNSLEEKVEFLAEVIMAVNIGDDTSLNDLEVGFHEVYTLATEANATQIALAAQAAALLVKRIRRGKTQNPVVLLRALEQTAIKVQSIVHGECIPEEVLFPDEIRLCFSLLEQSEKKSKKKRHKKKSLPVTSEEPVQRARKKVTLRMNDSTAKSPLYSDAELIDCFVAESTEHLEMADQCLLSLEKNPGDQDALNSVFRAFHSIKGSAGFLELEQIQSLAHQAENLLEQARQGTLILEKEAADLTFEVVDVLKNLVGSVQPSSSYESSLFMESLVPGLIDRLQGVALKSNDNATENKTDKSLSFEPPHLQEREKKPQNEKLIRVEAERLDRLLDAIGELVIAVSMVSQSTIYSKGTARAQQMGQVEKISRELQEMATSLRMVPIRRTFQKIARVVRDLARKADKPIDFFMSGEDAELDKSVVEQIGDPLVHLVRNAVDHGIESSAEERKSAGKSELGRVDVRAYRQGGNIHIEVKDDGRGLDCDAILTTARKRGLVAMDATLNEREIFNLIFEPGFSTARMVTDVSGRGVGMDVVRRNIEALRGQVEVRSNPNEGTTFSIQLPLTLAIIDGMAVRVGAARFVLPTLSMVMAVRPEKDNLTQVLDCGEMLSLHGELMPLFRLNELFGIQDAQRDPTRGLAVVVESDGNRTALLVDDLLGQQQIVIKSLGESIKDVPGVSGGAIMPDGLVGLILDVPGLVNLAHGSGINSSLTAAG